ncbi:hypothetical protein ABZZ74_39505 [Streptomyces sp. NPDC006476]|uniref:hypothetical protein n=1 Tax=Streptomyces sp. NPDC006476 TaxID=3157175 RepID=UPI0033AF5C4F
MRTLSRLGVDVRVGIAPSVTVAATASARIPQPGGVLAVNPHQTAGRLRQLPVDALHGIGSVTGGDAVGARHPLRRPACRHPAEHRPAPAGRVRTVADRARGIDPRPVGSRTPPASNRPLLLRPTLDGADVRAALLELAVRLGQLLRHREQATRVVALTVLAAPGSARVNWPRPWQP